MVHMLKEVHETVRGQMGPCGIRCGDCSLGNGTVSGTAKKLEEYLKSYSIASWAPLLPSGTDIDFSKLERGLEWLQANVGCLGCERGGGPPDCAIRACSKEKGYRLCSECPDLERCTKFNWLGDSAKSLKERLIRSKQKTNK